MNQGRFVLACLLAACVGWSSVALAADTPTPAASASVADGSSVANAIVLPDAKTEAEGVRSEHAWLAEHLPGARMTSQALVMHGRPYDILTVKLPSGETRDIYFDISSFFGKL